MPKKRLLIFHPALAPYRVDFFNELSKFFDLKIVFLRENTVNQQFDQEILCSRLACEFSYLTSGINFFGRQIRWGVGKVISQFQPDVVVSHEFSPVSLLVCLQKKMFPGRNRWRQLIWTADNFFMCEKCSFLRRAARKVLLGTVDGMVVYTVTARDWYASYGVMKERIGICPNIQKENVLEMAFQRALPLAKKYIQDYNLAGKRITLFVGRLAKVKGIDQAINAFAETLHTNPDAVFVIVGDGPEKDFLKDLVEKKGLEENIRFVGRFEGDALFAWYLVGQLFVLASNFEPYGAVVNEALLAGMPVLCSSKAGAADLIEDGQNGKVFDPYDVLELSKCMKNMLAAVAPLQNDSLALRKSLMPIAFADAVDGFVGAIHHTIKESLQ